MPEWLKDDAEELGPWWQWLEGMEYLSVVAAIVCLVGATLTLVEGLLLVSALNAFAAVFNYVVVTQVATTRRRWAYEEGVGG